MNGKVISLLLVAGTVSLLWQDDSRAQERPWGKAAVQQFASKTLDDAQVSRFRQVVQQQLRVAGVDLLSMAEVDRLLAVSDTSCLTTLCLEERVGLLGVEVLVGGSVEQTPDGAGYTLSFWRHSVDPSRRNKDVTRTCRGCTEQAALAWVPASNLVEELMKPEDPERMSRFKVVSNPGDAEVFIHGRKMGASGMFLTLSPGEHKVEVRHPVLGSKTLKVTLEPGGERVEQVDLRHGATASPGDAGASWQYAGVLKWVALGVGVAALGAGAALMAIDGRQTCDRERDFYQCAEKYETMAGGIGLAGAGVLSLGVAGYLFYVDAGSRAGAGSAAEEPGKKGARARREGASVAVSPWFGPGGGGLSARVAY